MTRFASKTNVILAVLVFAAVFVVTGCSEKIRPGEVEVKRKKSGLVSVATVSMISKERVYTAVGTVKGRNSATLSPQIMGRITAIRVREGEEVKKGDLLMTIDDSQAQAGLKAAESMLDEAMSAREEVEAAIGQAESGLELSKKTFERYKGLFEKRIISQQEFDEVSTNHEVAKRKYDMSLSRRRQVEAKVAQAEANIQNARVVRGYTRVVAPFDGIVARRFADLGSMASPGTPLFLIDEAGIYQILLSISEGYASVIKVGTACRVSIEAAGIEEESLTVSEIVPEFDPATRSFTVKVDLHEKSGVRAGMFGRATFSLGEDKVIAVPEGALVRVGGYEGVYAITKGDVARFFMVKTGERFGGKVEVLSGLSEGQRIIVSGLDQIRDGDVVEVAK